MKTVKQPCDFCGKPFRAYRSRTQKPARCCSRYCYDNKRRRVAPSERFWRHVVPRNKNQCWEWSGNIGSHGYGQFTIERGSVTTAPRFSYKLHFGAIPTGAVVRHTCDNKRCVNPSHLQIGTQKQNGADFVQRGHGNRGQVNGMAKLSNQDVIMIRTDKRGATDIAADYGITRGYVLKLKRGVHR